MGVRVVTCSASSIEGINNFGDELLTQIYHAWVAECDPSIQVHHLAVDGHGVLTRDARARIEAASCLVFTGGGYFADGYGFSLTLKRHARALRNRQVYWTVFKRARSLGIPCGVLGLEVGPLANPLYRRAVREILSAAQVVVVRNEESQAYATKLCGGSSVEVAFHLDAALARIPAVSASSSGVDRDSGDFCVGVHVHSVDDEIAGRDCVDLLTRIVAQAPSDRRVRLFYFHDQRKRGTHPSRSKSAEEYFSNAYPGTESVSYTNPDATVAAIAEMDLIITSKLHLGIVARSFGVPVLAIGAHPKIRRFYESIEEGDVCGAPTEFSSAGLPRQVIACLSGERRRVPIGDTFRESAMANRSAIRDLVRTLT
jgi:polysaccharide pyruvyl transferase WcaK-like protein